MWPGSEHAPTVARMSGFAQTSPRARYGAVCTAARVFFFGFLFFSHLNAVSSIGFSEMVISSHPGSSPAAERYRKGRYRGPCRNTQASCGCQVRIPRLAALRDFIWSPRALLSFLTLCEFGARSHSWPSEPCLPSSSCTRRLKTGAPK